MHIVPAIGADELSGWTFITSWESSSDTLLYYCLKNPTIAVLAVG